MKRTAKNIIIFALCMVMNLSSCIYVFAENKEKKQEYINSKKEIIISLKECEKVCEIQTGDVTADFLNQFIYANKIKIGLSENLIKYGENKEVRNSAKKCIGNSIENISYAEPILDCIKDNLTKNKEKEDKYLQEYFKIYNEMLYEMEKEYNEDAVDKIYLKNIICHGKFTLKMLDNIEKYNEDKGIVKLYTEVRKNQIKEINKMEKLLENLQ